MPLAECRVTAESKRPVEIDGSRGPLITHIVTIIVVIHININIYINIITIVVIIMIITTILLLLLIIMNITMIIININITTAAAEIPWGSPQSCILDIYIYIYMRI